MKPLLRRHVSILVVLFPCDVSLLLNLKTNQGDALANRVQSTLGSYEEMKDLLTSHSNQSHLGPDRPGPGASSQLFVEGLRASSSSCSSGGEPGYKRSSSSRGSVDWSRGAQGNGLLLDGAQMQRHEELFSSLKDELGLKGDSNRSSALEGCLFKSSVATESSGHVKSSPSQIETGSAFSSSSPLASTSVLTTPTPGLTTPTSCLATPTFPPGPCLSGKPSAVQQKPTAYVRPMDGQDQAPSDSPQLKPPLVVTEGYSSSQPLGGNATNIKNKLPKLSLGLPGETHHNNHNQTHQNNNQTHHNNHNQTHQNNNNQTHHNNNNQTHQNNNNQTHHNNNNQTHQNNNNQTHHNNNNQTHHNNNNQTHQNNNNQTHHNNNNQTHHNNNNQTHQNNNNQTHHNNNNQTHHNNNPPALPYPRP
ncbi:hypothetical protein NHX12_011518 [Muraenolepis orangiensis]|uniref:Uncharacterized protein n=1 Tax=Muraenolepis orangiensis TaxID=630683 RepID=A0A9Q0I7Q4_9TELE|nr:hypothetical protein NHX12_011518 [Muraenolepis orangiensis]